MVKPRKRTYRRKRVVGRGAYAVRPYRRRVQVRRPGFVRGSGKYDYPNVGRNIGRGIGGYLGEKAQQLIKHITGFGAYKISANSLMGGLYDPPELHNLGGDTVCVSHREYITDIVAANAFTLQSYAINPGLFATFPWLSAVAANFEEYRITGMIFEYKTLSADYTTAASASLGFVVMASQYNVYNPIFPDKKTMENYEFSNSAKPSDSFIHPIECKRALNPVAEMYVRTGAVTQGDLRLYDLANFQIATGGNSGTGILGELWVTFEVEFYKPKITGSGGIGYDLLTDHFQITGATSLLPMGTSHLLVAGSSLGTTITSTTIAFPAAISDGNYMVVLCYSGTSASIINPLFTFFNCSRLQYWINDTSSSAGPTNGSTNPTIVYSFIIQITSSLASFTVGSAGTLPSAIIGADLWITQINPSIIS